MNSSSGSIKGILVGCGFMGSMHAQVYNLLEGVELVAAVDGRIAETQQKLQQLGIDIPVFNHLNDALQATKCDFVDICLPTYLHAKAAIEVIYAGKALFCEKPLALSLHEADMIINAARDMKTPAQVGQCIRFWPEYQALSDYHKKQGNTALQSLQLTRRAGRPGYSTEDWLNNPALSGGAILDLHIHDVDYMLSLFGKPEKTTCQITRDHTGPVHIFTLCTYDNFTVSIEGGWNYPEKWGFQMSFQAIYDNAVLDYDSSHGKGLTLCKADTPPQSVTIIQPDAGASSTNEGNIASLGGYFNELKYFTDCIKNNQQPEIATLEQAKESLAFVLNEIEQASL